MLIKLPEIHQKCYLFEKLIEFNCLGSICHLLKMMVCHGGMSHIYKIGIIAVISGCFVTHA